MREATRTRRRQMGEQGRPGRVIIQQDGGNDSTIFDLVRVFLVEGRFDGANEELLGVGREVGRALDQIAAGCIPIEI
jgi:hypothetical protein